MSIFISYNARRMQAWAGLCMRLFYDAWPDYVAPNCLCSKTGARVSPGTGLVVAMGMPMDLRPASVHGIRPVG
ncbi:hypothetical protein ACCO45_001680 [Purpureocillium lilacinum]|uniref:Uncharacterized protein n=1 Tax=Purpureocillium lilacinum TaxID=33203 RepID=A0ACC4EAJ4_PURLI